MSKTNLSQLFPHFEDTDLCIRPSYDYLGDGLSGSQENLIPIETVEFRNYSHDQIGPAFLEIAKDLQNIWHERKTPKSELTIKPCECFSLLLPIILPENRLHEGEREDHRTHPGVCVSRVICDTDRNYVSVSEPLGLTTRRPSSELREKFWIRQCDNIRFVERVYLALEDRLQFETNDFLLEAFRDFVLAGLSNGGENCPMKRVPPRNPDPYKSYTEHMEELFPGTKPAFLL